MWRGSILTCIYYVTAVNWWVTFFVFSLHNKFKTKMSCRDYILRVRPTRCDVSQFIYFCKTLYMFQTVFPSIIRSSNVQFWAPDDERKNSLKHVERLTEINKLRNLASCWLYSENMLVMHGHMNVKYRDSLLIFTYVLYLVYMYGKLLKLIAEDIRLIPQQIQNIVQKMRYYIMKLIMYVLYVYVHFHLAALVTVQQEKSDKFVWTYYWSILIIPMLSGVFIIIISEAKLLKLFILSDHIIS